MDYPPLRLDHILVYNALCSPRSARTLLRNHDVRVNGVRCTDGSTLVSCTKDAVCIDSVPVLLKNDVYLMLNKPAGTVCTNVSDRHKTVFDFIRDEYKNQQGLGTLHSIGRLDADTEGLVLLTTNGNLSHRLTSPETHVAKTYLVHLRNAVDGEKRLSYAQKLAEGIEIPAEKKAKSFFSAPARLEWLDGENGTACRLTITEGKFHQVKRMFRALENEVVYLKRIAIGALSLDSALRLGEYRELTAAELCMLSMTDL